MKGETTKENIANMVKDILEKDMNIEVKWDWYKEIEKNPFKICQMLVEHIHQTDRITHHTPSIIHCKDCGHYEKCTHLCAKNSKDKVYKHESWYCADAEKID